MRVRCGTSGFSYLSWRGTFYPVSARSGDLLRLYGERFSTVEINNTFYHMPNGTVLTNWADQVGGDFVFGLKAPQVITHMKRLRHVSSETGYLFKSLSVLEKKLGPVLFQFPLDMAPVETEINRLNNQALVHYYESEWKHQAP